MTAAKTPPIHVLRRLLRHIRSAPKLEMPKANATAPVNAFNQHPLYQQVMSQYRANQFAPPAQADALRKMAFDMITLKDDLRERRKLHKLDGGAEVKLSPKELSRLAAHRAGLELPETA